MSTLTDSFDYIMGNFENLRDLDEGIIGKVCELIIDSKNIFVYGVGRSGIVGRMLGRASSEECLPCDSCKWASMPTSLEKQ